MRWAFKQSGLRSSVKFVLVALADRANEHHECWPSRDVIAADTCLNPETVSKATEELVALGLLEKRKRFGGSVVFRLVGVEERHLVAGNPATRKNPIQGKCRLLVAGNPAPNLPMNLEETPPTPQRGRRTAVRGLSKEPPAVPERINPLAWADWVAYRRDKRKPISERAAKAQWASLSTLTFDQQAECIAVSIANDWQGLFPGKAPTASTDTSPIARGGVWK